MSIAKALEAATRDPEDVAAVKNARGKVRQLLGVLAAVDERIAACNSELGQLDAEELQRVERRIPAAVQGGLDAMFTPDDADGEAGQRRAAINEDLRQLQIRRSALKRSIADADTEADRLKQLEVEKIVSEGRALHRKIVAQMAEKLAAVAELNDSEDRLMEALRAVSGRTGLQLARFSPCGLPGDSNCQFAHWQREIRQLGYPV